MVGSREGSLWSCCEGGEPSDWNRAALADDDYRMPLPAIGRWAAVLMLAGALALGGCTVASAPVPPGEVLVANFAFSPSNITVHVGQSLTWVFDQPDAPHNVHSTAGPTQIDSGTPQGKGKFTYTFEMAGTYKYMCQVHPNMTGTVIVTP